jgi:hypothetical protein
MPKPLEWPLEDFVREKVASQDEWEAWIRKPSPAMRPPRPKLSPPTGGRIFAVPEPDAAPANDERQQLKAEFDTRLRKILTLGEWRVSGRTAGTPKRYDLEPADWTNGEIDLRRDRIGAYGDIRIYEAPAEDQISVLRAFIEVVCGAADEPKGSLNKPVIETLARRLRRASYDEDAFKVAWRTADIDPRWRRGGRPRKSDSD